MKREDVKNKITGITEEQPNWLMQENGSDITREKFLSTLSLRRATNRGKRKYPEQYISIHALLAESDARKIHPVAPDISSISIHALLAESDVQIGCKSFLNSIFLSTLSLRRATSPILRGFTGGLFLSTLSLRRATREKSK